MAAISISVLTEAELSEVEAASRRLLRDVGLRIHHAPTRTALGKIGCRVDAISGVVRFPDGVVDEVLRQAPRQFALHGRDPARKVSFGAGGGALMSSPGQRYWLDGETQERREPTLADARSAIRLADSLSNIDIVGALAEAPHPNAAAGAAALAAELVQSTLKPGCVFTGSLAAARAVLATYGVVAGGPAALRERPMTIGFLDPISPLQLPDEGLAIAAEFARAGQPVLVASMALVSGTAPATLAGTLAQVNAEILGGITALQVLAPGCPVVYGGIPHVLDARTSQCSFGSPEQGLLALALVQLGRHHGLPVYANTGLTDALLLDAQAGMEKASTQTLGVLGGADLLGHAGICGADQAGSLEFLVADDALRGYLRRVQRGFTVNPATLAVDVIRDVGPGGSFLAEEHTVRHFRQELWLPAPPWQRADWSTWREAGCTSLFDRARQRAVDLLGCHRPTPLPPGLAEAIRTIASTAGVP